MASVSFVFPRVTIQFCTQCKWMLRAAYFAQELLTTFGNALAEVALQPATNGVFVVSVDISVPVKLGDPGIIQHHVLWDRKAEGGFPETKELKRRLRDIIEPGRDLGHVDGKKKGPVDVNAQQPTAETEAEAAAETQGLTVDEEASRESELIMGVDAFSPAPISPPTQEKEAEEESTLMIKGSANSSSPLDQGKAEGERLMVIRKAGITTSSRKGIVAQELDGSTCEDCN